MCKIPKHITTPFQMDFKKVQILEESTMPLIFKSSAVKSFGCSSTF